MFLSIAFFIITPVLNYRYFPSAHFWNYNTVIEYFGNGDCGSHTLYNQIGCGARINHAKPTTKTMVW